MRIIIAFLLVLVCTLLGIKFSRYYKERTEIYGELKEIATAFLRNFEFAKKPRGEVVKEISAKRLMEALTRVESVDELPLTKEEKTVFSDFFAKLGRENCEREKARCRDILSYIESRREELEKDKDKGRLIPRLAASVGALLGLIVW